MTTAASQPNTGSVARYRNAAEWLNALGDIPLDRIIFNPLPGTATEANLLQKVDVDKQLCELIDGTLVEKPMGWRESMIAMAVANAIARFMGDNPSGILTGADGGSRLRAGLVRLPDVAYVSYQRLPGGKAPAEPFPSLAPDLAVEVMSPSNTTREMRRKLEEYFAAGTQLVWYIYPDSRTAEVYTSPKIKQDIGEAGFLDGSTVLPGLTISLSKLFRDLPAE